MVGNLKKYLSQDIKWTSTRDADNPFTTTVNGLKLVIRVNDFPAEELYSLVVGADEINFDDWPKSWERSVRIAAKPKARGDRLKFYRFGDKRAKYRGKSVREALTEQKKELIKKILGESGTQEARELVTIGRTRLIDPETGRSVKKKRISKRGSTARRHATTTRLSTVSALEKTVQNKKVPKRTDTHSSSD